MIPIKLSCTHSYLFWEEPWLIIHYFKYCYPIWDFNIFKRNMLLIHIYVRLPYIGAERDIVNTWNWFQIQKLHIAGEFLNEHPDGLGSIRGLVLDGCSYSDWHKKVTLENLLKKNHIKYIQLPRKSLIHTSRQGESSKVINCMFLL